MCSSKMNEMKFIILQDGVPLPPPIGFDLEPSSSHEGPKLPPIKVIKNFRCSFFWQIVCSN